MFYREGKHWAVGTALTPGLWPRPNKWTDWLEAYNSAKFIDDRITLLYTGFNRQDKLASALIFYLKEAEGHADIMTDHFVGAEERGVYTLDTCFGRFNGVAEARQMIPKTAFKMLVNNFFKDTREKDRSEPSWLWLVKNKEVVDALLHFFRIDEDQHFVNLQGSFGIPGNQLSTVREFLKTWSKYPWGPIPRDGRDRHYEMEKFYYSRRLEFVDILAATGNLDYLLHNEHRDSLAVGEEELLRLESLALGMESYFPDTILSQNKKRRAVNVEEAAYAGSQAGKIAILLREKLKITERFRAKMDAELRRQQAEHELRELSADPK